MSKLRQEIRKCLSAVEPGAGDSMVGRLAFPADFIGFRGHFPGNPILPGVCLVESALVILEARSPAPLHLKEISSAKFFSPVAPDTKVEIVCRVRPLPDASLRLEATASSGGRKVAALVLMVNRNSTPAGEA